MSIVLFLAVPCVFPRRNLDINTHPSDTHTSVQLHTSKKHLVPFFLVA